MTPHQATAKVKTMLLSKSKTDVAKELNINIHTLEARLSFGHWRINEIYLIERI